jgi:hypothetical protein
MYKNLSLVSPQIDRDATIAVAHDYSHFTAVTSVPIGFAEAEAIANDYPILFTPSGHIAPIALLGLHGVNAYLDSESSWSASVMPGWLRLYPFVYIETHLEADKDNEPVWRLARDTAAPHFSIPGGEALFMPDGQPGPMLRQIIDQANHQHQDCLKAHTLTKELVEAGLIADKEISMGTGDALQRYRGFKAVDDERLASLDPETRQRLEGSGAMRLLELHKQSLKNLLKLYQAGAPAS